MGAEVAHGRVVAGFRLVSLVDEGATGAVYLAEDTVRGGRVALKVLRPELGRDQRFRDRFLRESELAARLDSPHVVRVIESGVDQGSMYLAMEYVEGADLAAILRAERTLSPARAVDLLGDVAAALDTAHVAGLVHRDIKPGNILVTTQSGRERALVCDFGLARHVSSASSLTGDRGFVGTIDYVPPEQIEGAAVDGRADVYALGCVLWECLTGAKPFERESELAVVFAHLNEQPPRAAPFGLPPGLDGVFARALAKRPEARFATAGELVEATEQALSGRRSRRPPRRRHLPVLVAVGLAAITAAVAAFLRDGSEAAVTGRQTITQQSIAGVPLGLSEAEYKRRLASRPGPGFTTYELVEPGFYALSFAEAKMGVYFPDRGSPAHIVTTWNEDFRTAAGIGPCSTVAELKRAYGDAVHASWAGTSPDGKTTWSWVVGDNLLFTAQDDKQERITAVALYAGDPRNTRGGSPQSYANYVAANERWCG